MKESYVHGNLKNLQMLKGLMFFVCLCGLTAHAQVSANYDAGWSVLSGGGGICVSPSANMGDCTGQVSAGVSASTAFHISAGFIAGIDAVEPGGLEGDVAPRPDGDGSLLVNDWVQVGRFVAGLDTPAAGSEFQKADCAPYASTGDGQLLVNDWVQAGRYVAGLDAPKTQAGPTNPTKSGDAAYGESENI